MDGCTMVKAKGELAVITDALRKFILTEAAQGTTSSAIIAQKVKAQWNKNVSADQVREVLEAAGPDAIKAIREEMLNKTRSSRKQHDLGMEVLLKIHKLQLKRIMECDKNASGNSFAALCNAQRETWKEIIKHQERLGAKPQQSSENAALLTIIQELYLAMTVEQHVIFDPKLKEKLGKEWDRIIGTKEQEGDAK